MKKAGAWVMLVVTMVLAACDVPPNDNRAQMLAEQYYQMVQSRNLEGASALYPEPEQALALAMLQETRDKNGDLKSFRFTGVEKNTVLSGRFYRFSVVTEYERGGEHEERLTVRSQVNSSDFVLVSQKIDAID